MTEQELQVQLRGKLQGKEKTRLSTHVHDCGLALPLECTACKSIWRATDTEGKKVMLLAVAAEPQEMCGPDENKWFCT